MISYISAEWIGKNHDDYARKFGEPPQRRPWLARISLRGKGFHRQFIKHKLDYSEANGIGSRGVFCCYEVTPGVYELEYMLSWRGRERTYYLATEDGHAIKGTKEDAERWLSEGLG